MFRATRIEDDGRRLILHEASIVNGRQTTGCLTTVRSEIADSCEVPVKVVQAEGDAWPIAAAANNQNSVARIDLRLARYFREQLVQREMASAASGNEWMTEVMQPLKAREERFDHLRYLFIGLFCRRPNQLADDNYSQIRWDVLAALFVGGEPPANLYPTLFNIVRATDDALQFVEGLGETDPLSKIHDDHRPKYRAYLGLLTLCATHHLDLAEQLPTLDSEVERIQEWVSRSAELLDGVGRRPSTTTLSAPTKSRAYMRSAPTRTARRAASNSASPPACSAPASQSSIVSCCLRSRSTSANRPPAHGSKGFRSQPDFGGF